MRPIALDRDLAGPEAQQGSRRKLPDAGNARLAAGQILQHEELAQGRLVPRQASDGAVRAQRADLGREVEIAVAHRVVERLFPEAVARQPDVAGRVAIGEGEHAVDALERALRSFASEKLEQHLGIRMVAQGDAVAPQPVGKRREPVDLAVIGERASVGIDARLRAAVQVDDREARVRQRDALVDMAVLRVGSAMLEAVAHALQVRRRIRPQSRACESADAAHVLSRPGRFAARRRP